MGSFQKIHQKKCNVRKRWVFASYICCFFYFVFAKSQLWNIFLVWSDPFQTSQFFTRASEGIFNTHRKRDKDSNLTTDKSLLRALKNLNNIKSINKTRLRKILQRAFLCMNLRAGTHNLSTSCSSCQYYHSSLIERLSLI